MSNKWYKLDNAAKIFPPIMDKYDPKVFRFSVSLKETIDKTTLEKALAITLIDFPIFNSILKKGIFWYYLEESDILPKVELETKSPCAKMGDGLLYRVNYYKKRINLEVYHALTDGTGTLMFTKNLIINYLNLYYKLRSNEYVDESSELEKTDDSFKRYHERIFKRALKNKEIAFKLKGNKYKEDQLRIIEGKISTKEMLSLSKKYNVSLTVYLTSILIDSIGKTMSLKERKKPIVVTIPVNLRNYYPSFTVRNFFSTVTIKYKYKSDSLEDIISVVEKGFHDNLTKENINNKMNSMAELENIFIVRLIPIFVKNFILKYSYKLANLFQTMTLSNIGVIKFPKTYEEYIDYFSVYISTGTIQVCLCSLNDNLVITFTSHFIESEIEKNFFRSITKSGVNVEITTNNIGEDETNE
ncbi:MAG: hypothetical protein RR478_01735 [Bacilli bacterium]